MKCPFKQDADGHWTCPRCGYRTKRPRDKAPIADCKKLGWGDWVARGLETVGITKKRVSAVKKAVTGKEDCGCQKRQEALNDLGARLGG